EHQRAAGARVELPPHRCGEHRAAERVERARADEPKDPSQLDIRHCRRMLLQTRGAGTPWRRMSVNPPDMRATGEIERPATAAGGRCLAETERSPEHRAKPEAPDQRSEGSAEFGQWREKRHAGREADGDLRSRSG